MRHWNWIFRLRGDVEPLTTMRVNGLARIGHRQLLLLDGEDSVREYVISDVHDLPDSPEGESNLDVEIVEPDGEAGEGDLTHSSGNIFADLGLPDPRRRLAEADARAAARRGASQGPS